MFHRIDAREVLPPNWFIEIALGNIMGIFLCIIVLYILKIFTVDREKRLFSLFQLIIFVRLFSEQINEVENPGELNCSSNSIYDDV